MPIKPQLGSKECFVRGGPFLVDEMGHGTSVASQAFVNNDRVSSGAFLEVGAAGRLESLHAPLT